MEAVRIKKIVFNLLIVLIYSGPINGAAALERILIIAPQGLLFETFTARLMADLEADFQFKTVNPEQIDAASLQRQMRNIDPNLVVLLGNKSITLYKQYQLEQPEDEPVTPSLSMLGIRIDSEIEGLKNATGISYEVPLLIASLSLNNLVATPIEKIGVVYRPNFKDYLDANQKGADWKGLNIVGVEVPVDADAKELNSALSRLRKEDVDAIWVLTDSHLLSNEMIRNAWLKQLSRIKRPVVVGTPILVNADLPFGVISVHPDNEALVIQASDLILQIADSDWLADEFPLQHPLSVKKKLNLKLVNQWRIALKELASKEVDEVVE